MGDDNIKKVEKIEEKVEIDIPEYTEEEITEMAIKEVRRKDEEMTKQDLEKYGRVTSTTARSIEDIINEEIKRQKENSSK